VAWEEVGAMWKGMGAMVGVVQAMCDKVRKCEIDVGGCEMRERIRAMRGVGVI
jgi:hypothetical protein